jgi:hypothetical protein
MAAMEVLAELVEQDAETAAGLAAGAYTPQLLSST